MKTLGGSTGQSLVGALSTGVHGSDFDRGTLADVVRAIHLVGPGGIQHWIEPTSGITESTGLAAIHTFDNDFTNRCGLPQPPSAGDGKTDFAVWRPSKGNWYIIDSSTGATSVKQWGQAGDIPFGERR